MIPEEVAALLEQKYRQYNCRDFIANDPVSIPHRFTRPADIEIAGLFAAVLAWGQRKTIISKCTELMDRMNGEPYLYVTAEGDDHLKSLTGFKHRTFNDTDLLYFVEFLRFHYSLHESLEDAFLKEHQPGAYTVEGALTGFRKYFFSLPYVPGRTGKHISSPASGAACKRLVMYLRWMVRHDDRGVDFGLWKRISTRQLICPCDVHVDRVARKLGLITRKQTDWQTAKELTKTLQELDEHDPVRFDFALFGLGVEEKF